LPLEVGISCVTDFVIATMAIPLGVAILVAAALIAYWAEGVNDAIGYIALGGVIVVGFGLRKLWRAWRARPTDIVLETDGLRVDGGPHHGLSLLWAEIGVPAVVDVTTKDDVGRVCELRLGDLAIAEADDDGEIMSLEEVASALDARIKASKGLQPTARASSCVLACHRCGAPLAPAAEESVVCAHCAERTGMPPDVRERVRAAAEWPAARRRVDRLAAHLLDQPGARSTTILLVLSLALIGGAWPATVWAYVHAYRAHHLTLDRGFELAALPFLLVIDGFFLSRVRMVDRRALASFVTVFGASPPVVPGDPPRCRSCGAPLRTSDDATVVRCVFCDVSNVTGVDLRSLAGRTEESQDSLEEELRRRGAERWKWRALALASTPLVAATGFVVRDVYRLQSVHAAGKLPVEDLRVEGVLPRPSLSGTFVLFQTEKEDWQLLDMRTRKTNPLLVNDQMLAAWLASERYAVVLREHGDVSIRTFDTTPGAAGHTIASVPRGSVRALFAGGNDELAVQLGDDILRIPASASTPVALQPDSTRSVARGELGAFTADGRVLTRDDVGALAHADPSTDKGFALSPDGRRIAFSSTRGGGSNLYVTDVGGAGPRALTLECEDCADPAWSGDGWIYFVSHGWLHRLKP
jgi:hypothetical protein